jgi:flagellin
MRINNNIMAMNTHRQLGIGAAKGERSTERLSSGIRINRAGDDAAGLAISEKMRAQIRGLGQASRNAQDGISMIQTAEGALGETHAILQRMRELAVQSSNDTNVAVDRGEIQKEMDEMAKEITRIANNTEFNTQKLINGGIDDAGIKSTKFHVGANASQDITLSINAMDAKSLGVSRDVKTATVSSGVDVTAATLTGTLGSGIVDGAEIAVTATLVSGASGAPDTFNVTFNVSGTSVVVSGLTGDETSIAAGGAYAGLTLTTDGAFTDTLAATVTISFSDAAAATFVSGALTGDAVTEAGIDVSTQEAASTAITTIQTAIETVSAERSKLGAYQNRLDHSIKNLDTSSENLQAAESRIRDVDMAAEMMEFTKNNILQQAAQAMLAQANQAPQGVLQLLR